jgi:hypothetical protein
MIVVQNWFEELKRLVPVTNARPSPDVGRGERLHQLFASGLSCLQRGGP